MFQLIPQAVAGGGKVPSASLDEEAILYLPLKQKDVKDFILPIFWNLLISSDSTKICIFIIGLFFIWSPIQRNVLIQIHNRSNCKIYTWCNILSRLVSIWDHLGRSSLDIFWVLGLRRMLHFCKVSSPKLSCPQQVKL